MVSRGHVDATPTPSSGPRSRTRTAIMTAALAAWTRDFSASLTDIADRADVSRSTLHRYFPERQDLVDAVLIDSLQVVDAVATAANNGTRAPLDHLIYLLRSLVEVSDRVVFLFADPRRFAGNPHWGDASDASVRTLIAAAQAEGTLDPELPTEWIDGVYNAHIFLAAEAAQRGTAPSHAVADNAIRTFLGGVGVPRST
ncbi:TetR/AcrR family transcriptional regulator [Nocardia sp. XZ_19_369]|uniref:TetR/AcrR family transcriptional regulator n=1 Tax=Nocardia sp. XZ_19_369 TaxID=2769487 RepID=UPI00188EA568|nr:TetR/AcrR family transcriptional regulator [Nocardia sp. XZ_19_369]